jgi:AcrR family transcriptional regulator
VSSRNDGAATVEIGCADTLSRERVGELQRARILAAMIELVCERGVAGVTVAHIVGRSGVSRRTFYELFEDRADCLLAAFEYAVARATAEVLPAYEVAGSWEARIRAGLAEMLAFLDREPALAGLCVVDALAGERPVLEHRARVVGVLVDVVHQGGAPARSGGARPAARRSNADRGTPLRPARIVAEGVVGAVLAVIHARLCEPQPQPQPLVGLLNQLMSIVVLPYLGPVASGHELERPVPRARRRAAAAPRDPLRELDMRLTYRTVRVLLAIAEHAGASSREIADASGVSDQGQISKLLWRLEHLGLIGNRTQRHGRGEPNAWTLTAKGDEVARAIRTQTES